MRNKTAKKLRRMIEAITVGMELGETRKAYRKVKVNYKAIKQGRIKPD